jgi:hypothetical protein
MGAKLPGSSLRIGGERNGIFGADGREKRKSMLSTRSGVVHGVTRRPEAGVGV